MLSEFPALTHQGRRRTPSVGPYSVANRCALVLISRCGARDGGSSSTSVEQSRDRGVLVAEYRVPAGAALGPYRPAQVWVENHSASGERRLVIRLDGPHVDTEPRVRVAGLDDTQYRGVWSERNGAPYEVWAAPDPLPAVITLERGGTRIDLVR